MKERKGLPNISIRIDPDILHQAKIEAVKMNINLGEWLAKAITEKIERERS